MHDPAELKRALNQFIGGDPPRFERMFPKLHYTEGFKFFMENAGGGAFWLRDILATEPKILAGVRAEGFGAVELKVEATARAKLRVHDGNGKDFYVRDITYTDCPRLVENGQTAPWVFFMEPVDEAGTILVMLPQER